MTSTFKKIIVFVALVCLLPVFASASAVSPEFSVIPELPDNQRQNGNTFFDLLVHPGQRQTLFINIINLAPEDIVVLVEAVTASTGSNGNINYSETADIMDPSLKFPFHELASLQNQRETIPAHQEKSIPISLSIPDEPFDGMLLGSIRVLKEITEEERQAGGMILNQYAYVIAVRLVQDENAENIPPDFTFGGVSTQLINHRASIVANIHNTAPKLIKGADISAQISQAGADAPLFELSMPAEFAPNSILPLVFTDMDGRGLIPGDYNATVRLQYEGRIWDFEESFTIDPRQADSVNEGAINLYDEQSSHNWFEDIPLWARFALGIGGLALILLIASIIRLFRKKMRPVTLTLPPFPQQNDNSQNK